MNSPAADPIIDNKKYSIEDHEFNFKVGQIIIQNRNKNKKIIKKEVVSYKGKRALN
jgi:hypothetical protein